MLFAKAGSNRTDGKSHMEELMALDEVLTKKALGLKQIFQLADKGLSDPVRLQQAAG